MLVGPHVASRMHRKFRVLPMTRLSNSSPRAERVCVPVVDFHLYRSRHLFSVLDLHYQSADVFGSKHVMKTDGAIDEQTVCFVDLGNAGRNGAAHELGGGCR